MDLGNKQKTVLVVALFLIALIGLFPPWISNLDVLDSSTNEVRPGYVEPGGRAFLFAPPKPVMSEKQLIISRSIDYSRLIVEWLVIGFFTASVLGLLTLMDERRAHSTGADQDHEKVRAAA